MLRLRTVLVAALIAGVLAAIPGNATAAGPPVFINEIHYDNASSDTGEAIEIAGPAGTNLAEWTVALYNGSTWTTDTPEGIRGLNAVFMAQPNEAIVGGVNTTAYAYTVPTNHYSQELSGQGALEVAIHAIWSDCNGRHYAVGGDFISQPFTGLAFVRTIE